MAADVYYMLAAKRAKLQRKERAILTHSVCTLVGHRTYGDGRAFLGPCVVLRTYVCGEGSLLWPFWKEESSIRGRKKASIISHRAAAEAGTTTTGQRERSTPKEKR